MLLPVIISSVSFADTWQEMEQERLAREKDEKEKADKAKKIKEQFGETNTQWEKDKSDMQNLATQEKKTAPGGSSKPVKKTADGSKPVKYEES